MTFSLAELPLEGDANTSIFYFVNSLHANVAAAEVCQIATVKRQRRLEGSTQTNNNRVEGYTRVRRADLQCQLGFGRLNCRKRRLINNRAKFFITVISDISERI
jgi:hypothetical protein